MTDPIAARLEIKLRCQTFPPFGVETIGYAILHTSSIVLGHMEGIG